MRKTHINQLVLMENIEFGERVREFTVYGNTAAGWKYLCIGSSLLIILKKIEVN